MTKGELRSREDAVAAGFVERDGDKEYRGLGIGTVLMRKMLAELKERGYRKNSLAVQKANYAVKMYLDVGFQIIDENEEEYIMVYEL